MRARENIKYVCIIFVSLKIYILQNNREKHKPPVLATVSEEIYTVPCQLMKLIFIMFFIVRQRAEHKTK